MSILHVIYRIDLLAPSTTDLQGIINHLYKNNPPHFYQILQKGIDEILTNIPGSPLSVIGSGVLFRNNTIEAHMWAQGMGRVVTEDIVNIVRTFEIERGLEFPALKCGNIQRYRVLFRLGFTFQNGFIDVEYPLQSTS